MLFRSDVLEGKDGERRSVEMHERDDDDRVRYRRAGGNLGVGESATLCECDISAWRRWATEAEVLHAAHKPLASPTRRKRRELANARERRSRPTRFRSGA